MARQHPEEPTLVELTIEEVKAMGKQGMAHPSTRPVLIGGAIGTQLAVRTGPATLIRRLTALLVGFVSIRLLFGF